MGSAEISRDVPFLDDLPFEPVASAGAGPPPVAGAPIDEPGETVAPGEPSGSPEPSEPPTRGPRLARGLASFSRDNARREKKFAHLLRNEPGADDKRPDPPRRRR
jgi:hypothetical protein